MASATMATHAAAVVGLGSSMLRGAPIKGLQGEHPSHHILLTSPYLQIHFLHRLEGECAPSWWMWEDDSQGCEIRVDILSQVRLT